MNKNTTKTDSEKILRLGLEPQWKAYKNEIHNRLLAVLGNMRKELEAAGWDLEKVAPYPNSMMGRVEYRLKVARYSHFRSYFQSTKSGARNMHDPDIVVEKPDSISRIAAEAKRAADDCFDSFTFKMAQKIAKDIKSAKMTGLIWDGCQLTVNCEDGTTQVWNTKCIMNVSCLGKVFNQWPSRLVK